MAELDTTNDEVVPETLRHHEGAQVKYAASLLNEVLIDASIPLAQSRSAIVLSALFASLAETAVVDAKLPSCGANDTSFASPT